MVENFPKPGSPEYVWINHAKELQALVLPSDLRFQEYAAMATGEIDATILDVAAFCAAPQPDFVDIDIPNLLDGTWKEQLRNCSLASVYYRLCQDAEGADMLLRQTTTFNAADLEQTQGLIQQIVDAPGANKIAVPVFYCLRMLAVSTDFTDNEDVKLGILAGRSFVTIPAAWFQQHVNKLWFAFAGEAVNGVFGDDLANQPVIMTWAAAKTGGDALFSIDTFYVLIDV